MPVPDAALPSTANTKSPLTKAAGSSLSVSHAGTGSGCGSGISEREKPSLSRVYSPSETADWLTCPIYRGFRKSSTLAELHEDAPHRWQARGGDWEPARVLGTAVQTGYNVYLQNPHAADDAIAEHEVLVALMREFVPQPRYTLEGLAKLALRGVDALLKADLFDRHQILMVDEPLSSSRPDVVSRHETQGLGVSDFKVSQRVDERYRTQRLSAYSTDDQFWHYAWEVGETLGEPVKWIRPIVVILTPKATVLHDMVEVSPARLKFWLEGAEQHWRDMAQEDRGERATTPRWPACRGGKFGVCEFFDGCHSFDRDPRKMGTYYERVIR